MTKSAGLMLHTAISFVWLATSFQQVTPIPMTQRHCTPSDIIKLSPGSSLVLECGSHCPVSGSEKKTNVEHSSIFSWRKFLDITGSVTSLPDTMDPLLSVESVTHEHGGHYVCKCLPNGPECMYNVSIIPEMTFEPSQWAVHYGAKFDLTCTVRGFPANFTTINTERGVELDNQIRGRLDTFTTRSFVPITNSEEREFVCVSESFLLGSLVTRMEKHISIKFYTPPVIIFTTELSVRSQDDFGKPGHLMCTVQTSPDAITSVAWWVNGTQIDTENNAKYHSDVDKLNSDDVLQYRLVIGDLQHSDIGSYLCQLSTEHRVEDSQEAWLQVDFRKGSDKLGRTHHREEYKPNQWRGNSPDSQSDILFFGVCSITMIGFILGLWKLATSKKGWSQSKTTPIIGCHNVLQATSKYSSDHAHSLSHQVSFRRKLPDHLCS